MLFLLPLLFALIWFVLVFGSLTVWIWALVDALTVPADVFYRSGSKLMWGLLIGLLGPIAGLVYFGAGRPHPQTRQWIRQQKQAGVDLRFYGQPPPPGFPGTYGHPGSYGHPAAPPHPGAPPAPQLPASGYATTPHPQTPHEQWVDDREWLTQHEQPLPGDPQAEGGEQPWR
ncbi:hypothetical protein [Euzebya tangerina]|uniref:hypothetical protein n=1 Tax=Euzebya tangerina TaxID=591198 RepID=UPI000E3124A0|nr:hypothetical protein [Euzebya tangerina]